MEGALIVGDDPSQSQMVVEKLELMK